MAISWGSWDNRFQVGIDISQSPSSVSSSTTSVKLTIKFYVRTDMNAVNDTQTLTIRGPGFTDRGVEFSNTTANSSARLVATETYTRSLSYSSSYTADFSASLSGVYNGATPSKSRSWTIPKRPPGVPDKVATPTASPLAGGTSVDVRWSTPGGNGDAPTGYDVLVETPGGTNVDRRNSGTDNYHRMYGLSPGSSYTVRVRAKNSAGWGPWSNTRSFTAPAQIPGQPAAPTFTNVTATSVYVNYKNPASNGATISKFEINVEKDGDTTDLFQYTDTNGTPFTGVNQLVRATKYAIQVRAYNSAGWGPWSPRGYVTTLATRPDQPPAPRDPGSITSSSAFFYGSSNSNGGASLTNLRWRYSTKADMSGAVTITAGEWAGKTVTNLARATTYYLQQAVFNAMGWSDWSPSTTFTTLATVPDQPAVPTVSNITSTSARVNYTDTANGGAAITQWQVRLENGAGTELQVVTDPDGPDLLNWGGLTRKTTYRFRVRALNSVGWSAWSDARSFTTPAEVPNAPAKPGFSKIGPTDFQLDWTWPTDDGDSVLRKVQIQVSDSTSFASPLIDYFDSAPPANPAEANSVELTPAKAYYVRVRGVNDIGSGPWSQTATVTTLSGAEVKVNGSWRTAKVWVKVNGSWRLAKVWKKKGGTWQL